MTDSYYNAVKKFEIMARLVNCRLDYLLFLTDVGTANSFYKIDEVDDFYGILGILTSFRVLHCNSIIRH